MKKLISRCNFLKMGALASAVMMLAACGGGAGGGKDSAANVDVTGTVSFPLAEQVTFTGMTSYPVGSESEPNNRTIFKRLEEATNVHIDWTAIQADQWSDKITLNMSNPNTLTDFVFTADFSDSDLLRYADQGVIVNLEDYIDNNMPNLKKVFEMYPEYRTMCTDSEGHIWALPWIEQLGSEKTAIQTVGNMSFINKKWLDFLGLEMPTTVDEFEQVLIAFRDNAELLLGADAAKMVPFSISTDIGWRADLLNVSKVPEDVSDETLYVYGYDDRHLLYPNYKEGIRVLNQWYNEGLIWKDFALYTDASVEDDMMKSGFVGAFIHNWDYPYRNGEDSIQANLTRANGADAGFIAVDCFQNDAGITRKYLADRIDRKVFFPATNDEPLASLLYLNFISSEETIKFLQTGKEGVTYKMTDNGAYEMLNATGEWIMNSGMNIDHTITVNGLYLGDATAATKALSYPGVNPDFIITANTYGKLNGRIVKKFSCGAISAEEDVGTSLNSKRDAMLTQAVVAPVDQFDSVYDKGMADYLASGGQNIIDERREKLEAIYGVHVD